MQKLQNVEKNTKCPDFFSDGCCNAKLTINSFGLAMDPYIAIPLVNTSIWAILTIDQCFIWQKSGRVNSQFERTIWEFVQEIYLLVSKLATCQLWNSQKSLEMGNLDLNLGNQKGHFKDQNGNSSTFYGPPRGKHDGVIWHILERENGDWMKK